MNRSPLLFALAALMLSACTEKVTGQQQRGVPLTVRIDSVSYGIGTDVGRNLKGNLTSAGLDDVNMDAMFDGMRDAMDSVERIPEEQLKQVVQSYMMEAQEKQMAEQQGKDDAVLAEGKAFLAENAKKQGITTTASGLQYEVLKAGTGPKPVATDTVRVNYKGMLINGVEFDSSTKHGKPMETPLDRVIPGWTEALELMPVGSSWKLYIPSELAWGTHAAGEDIPANSVVIFEVELLGIVNK